MQAEASTVAVQGAQRVESSNPAQEISNSRNQPKQNQENSGPQRNQLLFLDASQQDIIRAHQKDNYMKKQLEEKVKEAVISWIGHRFTIQNHRELKLFVGILYFCLTTLRGLQTLGEEYCDIRQVDVKNNVEVGSSTRLKLFWWSEIFPYACERISSKLNVLTRPSYSGIPLGQSEFRTKLNNFVQRITPFLKDTISYFSKIHLGAFYMGGYFFEFSKRLSGIKYIFDRPFVMYQSQYHILGLLIFIQIFISTYSYIKTIIQLQRSTPSTNEWIEENYLDERAAAASKEEESPEPDCVLCLEPRKYPTVAECGHIFCWNCIHDSCQTKPECPLCRQAISPQSLTDRKSVV